MRWMLLVASALVALVGIQLFILTEQTDRYFAWTVSPPITAAFLGAAFWSSCLLEFLASRQRTWVNARVAVPAVLLFTTLMLVATLVHLDKFHPDSAVAWVWIAVYAIVPPALLIILIRQLRAPGGSPPRSAPLPLWLRLVSLLQAAAMLALGVALFINPTAIAPLWPWMLTPLTARAVGAWLVALGVAAIQVSLENDWARARVALPGYALLGVLELVALARYPNALDWSQPRAWLYLLFVLSVLVVGAYGWLTTRRATRELMARAG